MSGTGIRFVVDAPPGSLGTRITKGRGPNVGPCITGVQPTSPVASILNIGDIIEAVDGTPLKSDASLDEWITMLTEHSAKSRKLSILRPIGTATTASAATVAVSPEATNPNPIALAKVTNQSSSTKLPLKEPCQAKAPKKVGKALAKTPKKNNKRKKTNVAAVPPLNLDEMPQPGFISKNMDYYATLNNETTTKVAEKLGCPSWKSIATVEENTARYGELKGSSTFKASTYLRIPSKGASKFKLQKLVDQEEIDLQELAVCLQCGGRENPNNPHDPPMLLCDGCDVACHLKCSDQDVIPKGEWFCAECLEILQARQARYGSATHPRDGRSLVVHGPPKAPPVHLSPELESLVNRTRERLGTHLMAQRDVTMPLFRAKHTQLLEDSRRRLNILRQDAWRAQQSCIHYRNAVRRTKRDLYDQSGIVDAWGCGYDDEDPYFVSVRGQDGGVVKMNYRQHSGTLEWTTAASAVRRINQNPTLLNYESAYDGAYRAHREADEVLSKAEREFKKLPTTLELELQEREREYAGMLEEPKLSFETVGMYKSREGRPRLLGFVKVSGNKDVGTLFTLKEPTQLIVTLPLETQDDPNDILLDRDYAIFARDILFCPNRDDELPMTSHGGTRLAQRDLMEMLLLDPRNEATKVSQPRVPSSVRVRGHENESEDYSKCFDLSELVRDCTCDLDLPMAPTPPKLAQHGLQLRDYQKTSLQFMLDKENDATGLGFAGELWSRNRTFEGNEFYFCSLTGTYSLDIFNYSEEAVQKGVRNDPVAKHCGGFPRGGVLGEEMGLGKTVICISLITANPPAKENRVLAREYKFDEKPTHKAYSPPPSVYGACSAASRKVFLSNGTLVIAPMTLCSQWQTEIQKFAPWLTTLTIHNSEKPSVEELASVDVVIASTVAVQNKKKNNQTVNHLKRIHFHRILVDESHYQQQGQKTCQGLAKLSSTYRWGVTGTPIGSSLDDLHGQLRFLRLSQFTREAFWKNAISDPFIERNTESLRVLRSLLSHVVVRHSKEQTVAGGKAMLALPPRTVTTEIVPFGSEHERSVYNALETRNQQRFQELRHESVNAVLNRFVELTGMMFGARQACSHSCLVDLYRLEHLNNSFLKEKKRQQEKESGKPAAEYAGGIAKDRASILARAVEWAPESAKNRVRRIIMKFQEGEVELMECPICLDPFSETEAAVTQCGHPFCSECVLGLLDGGSSFGREERGRCASCRADIFRSRISFLGDAEDAGHFKPPPKPKTAGPGTVEVNAQVNGFSMTENLHVTSAHDSQTPRCVFTPLTEEERLDQRAYLSTLSQPFLESFEKAAGSIGTKVSRLLEEIKTMMGQDPTNKAVVFSQFLGTLDCAAQEMAARGIRFVRIDDSMKQHERADALHDFSTDPNVRVILLSMRAGAVGLTLTAANWCFILDTPLNSAVEEQSIDRIHRIGQLRPVHVKRLVMENTVEERILAARRSLAADRPQASAQIDGTGLVAKEQNLENRPVKRARLGDEEAMAERRFEKLATLEMLFGCSSDCQVVKA